MSSSYALERWLHLLSSSSAFLSLVSNCFALIRVMADLFAISAFSVSWVAKYAFSASAAPLAFPSGLFLPGPSSALFDDFGPPPDPLFRPSPGLLAGGPVGPAFRADHLSPNTCIKSSSGSFSASYSQASKHSMKEMKPTFGSDTKRKGVKSLLSWFMVRL